MIDDKEGKTNNRNKLEHFKIAMINMLKKVGTVEQRISEPRDKAIENI